ncbi:MAG TPA: hypothetical protein VK928_08360 [Longimicrobiales bacterium]|nr:hypothetical protein [Longimicrobiales bacterium]
MSTSHTPGPVGLDLFWEEADLESAAEHPLERELANRLDALARYGEMVDSLADRDDDDALDCLAREQARVMDSVDALYRALARTTSAPVPRRVMSRHD